MVRGLAALSHHLHALEKERAEMASDGQLLEWFLANRDEDAFATLVRRYGSLVLRVSQGVLSCRQDAEDVFQATFLVLARKASSIRNREAVGSFLHGVAYRLACKLRARTVHRQEMHHTVAEPTATSPLDELAWREVHAILQEEVSRLADRYRAPLLLCYWEGKTHAEAAALLGWKQGTVKERLERARDLLRDRLGRRGLALSSMLPALLVGQGTASGTLVQATVRAVFDSSLALASVQAAALAREACRTLLGMKLRSVLALLTASVLLFAGTLALQPSEAAKQPGDAPNARRPESVARQPSRLDRYGDPLPPGALARLGTVRLRHGNRVMGVAFSPDGKVLASVGDDEFIRLWDSATGKQVRQFRTQPKEQTQVLAFSPDGTKLVSAGEGASLRLWDIQTGKPLMAHKSPVSGVAFAPDGRTFASADEPTGRRKRSEEIRVWDAVTGNEVARFEGSGPIAYSPDSKILAGGFGEAVRLWNLDKRIPLLTIDSTHEDGLTALAFVGAGKKLVSGGRRADFVEVRLWDSATGKLLGELKTYYHEDRPHQGVGNVPLNGQVEEPVAVLRLEDIVCHERLGGILKHYSRAA